jgi:3'-phosphoadenosine 5'-phosphosulfate (PAPS) 3'-phosphatase
MSNLLTKLLLMTVFFHELCVDQEVQKSLLQSDVRSKSDKSPVTAADYG